jgi:aminomethyltransferase
MSAPQKAELSALKNTQLHALHRELGARMAPFAGYDMPIQYPLGILKEHLHTRSAAGLFDVSHMGQVEVRPKSGNMRDAAQALETVVSIDVIGLAPGRQHYAVFTNEAGGILDDLMISHCGDHYLLVVNASRKDEDVALLTAALAMNCVIERRDDRALVALQGPAAESAIGALCPIVKFMNFMDVRSARVLDADCILARSGYTGEDGFEISTPSDAVESIARALLEHPSVAMIGLGARDSLRLEAGFCLYGSDIDDQTTPVEAAIGWTIQKSRRSNGERAGGFPGADVILSQLKRGTDRLRVGLTPVVKTPVRRGAQLFADEESRAPIGIVTSGGFGPSADAFVAMGYVDKAAARTRPTIYADVRGKRAALRITDLPFVAHRYRR